MVLGCGIGAVFAEAVDFHNVGEVTKAAVAGLGFKFGVKAEVEAFGAVALSADEVMKMLIGAREFEQLATIFKDDALDNADRLEGFEGAVNRDEVGIGQAGAGEEFVGGGWAVEGQECAEDAFAFAGDAQGAGAKASCDSLKQLSRSLGHVKATFNSAFW